MFRILFVIHYFLLFLYSSSLISPIPLDIEYNEQKALLGKKLFFERSFSKDDTISCASCHLLESGGDDGLKFSVGVEGRFGNINAPTVYNSFFNIAQFWDGRAKDLEEQALGPIHNPVEMDSDIITVIEKLKKNKEYVELFKKIYNDEIKSEYIQNAIMEFEKALITPNSRFDRFLRGEEDILEPIEKKGFEAFKKYGCISCHNGINIGGNIFQKFGIFKEHSDHVNFGRFSVTKNEDDLYYFKVPTLRNISKTAPYFHDGGVKTLKGAIETMAEYQLGQEIPDDDIEAIYKFLLTLDGQIPEIAK